MAIPERQLEIWSHQGSVTQSSETYATIRRALEADGTPYSGRDCHVYLQGSYGNDTNIYNESDVDIVIETGSIFYSDLKKLSPQEKAAHQAAYPDPDYSLDRFKRDVFSVLTARFGSAVRAGKKTIKVGGESGRRDADVLVAAEYRRYRRFRSLGDEDYEKGICFLDATGTRIINYPRQHRENCTAKHQSTERLFKPTVRVLKNMREKLVESGAIGTSTAPSYFIEGLLYNVPNRHFAGSYNHILATGINWLLETNRTDFVCVNEQYYLLRDSPETWSARDCDRFLNAIVEFWNN